MTAERRAGVAATWAVVFTCVAGIAVPRIPALAFLMEVGGVTVGFLSFVGAYVAIFLVLSRRS